MKYSEIKITSKTQSDLKTETLFNIASERASGNELLLFRIDDSDIATKMFAALIRILKSLKSSGGILLYADSTSFESSSREAEYLINKYPEFFSEESSNYTDKLCVLVRL